MTALGLSTNDADFYTAVATAIPVLLVAYAFLLRRFAADNLGSSYDASMKVYVLSLINFASRRSGAFKRAIGATLTGSGSLLALIAVCLLVLVPGVSEYAALHALYAGSASSLTKWLSLIGVLLALLVVIAPLTFIVLRSFSFVPAISFFINVTKNVRDVRTIYSDWKSGNISQGWADPGITFALVNDGVKDGPQTTWTGPDQLQNFVSAAWSGKYPEWNGAFLRDQYHVVVLDRVDDAVGATVFTLKDGQVTELVAYRDREAAMAPGDLVLVRIGQP